MAEGGDGEDFSQSVLLGSDGDEMRHSIVMGSQDWHEFYCQPCDIDDKHVEASVYCANCKEYMCKNCCMSHNKFKQMSGHVILDLQNMPNKPPVRNSRSSAESSPGNTINPTSGYTTAVHMKDINISDVISSFAVLSKNKLIVAYTKKVELIDTVSDTVVSKITLSGDLGQVTRISDTEAAVTLPRKRKITLLRSQPKLLKFSKIRVDGECSGIAHCDNKLIVIFSDGRVNIISLTGNVLHTLLTDRFGFCKLYATASPDNSSMYVSKLSSLGGEVVKLGMDGSELAAYSNISKACNPSQVAIDSQGLVYVAWAGEFYGGHVVQMTADCEKLRTIIHGKSVPTGPLSYDEATGKLYIGTHDGVRVYLLE